MPHRYYGNDSRRARQACSDCGIHQSCLSLGLDGNELDALDNIVNCRQSLPRGAHLFRSGDSFRNLYVVRSGLLKTYSLTRYGDEVITGFHFPGMLVGLDAIATSRHSGCAQALDTTAMCELPFAKLDDLSARIPELRHRLMRLMSHEIIQEENMVGRLAQLPAEGRLAAYLIQVANHYQNLGFSTTEFPLQMSNIDLGRYLGISGETVSRVFSRFRERGVAEVQQRQAHIHDMQALRSLVESSC